MEEISLGKICYEAYCDYRNWKSFSGETLPPWNKLPVALQEAWLDAAEAVEAMVKHRMEPEE